MNYKLLSIKGSWREVADAANTTVGKDHGTKEPSSQWKYRMLLAEHSPIRQLVIKFKWEGIKYWISTQFTRSSIGMLHFVKSQRTDRTGIDRDILPQSTPVNHEFEANAQAMINMSRKRLCNNASFETRGVWIITLDSIMKDQPELYKACVPECIYRGWCYEMNSCGYHLTEAFHEELKEYRSGINGA